jgi:serine protease inhibitor
MVDMTGVVRAANGLAGRWAEALPGAEGTVYAPVGVWPLLGFLAAGADGAARGELEDALGVRADEAADAARALLEWLGRLPGVSAALGLWTRRELALEKAWTSALPEHALGGLTGDAAADRRRLDAWAAEATNGLIGKMPVVLDAWTRLVLASGLVVRTRWIRPFEEGFLRPERGPWAGRPLAGLRRRTRLLDRAAVLRAEALPDAPAVTELRVVGGHGIDVHLLLGPEDAGPGAVLRTGIEALAGRAARLSAEAVSEADLGPGMSLSWERSRDENPRLSVTTVPFTVSAEHDLLQRSALFGLTTAADATRGHFPGITRSEPLAVQSARQTATAAFSAEGFVAAAVTAFGMVAAGAFAPPPFRAKRVAVVFDRPFGFLAVQRGSGLVLAGGWVREPEEFPRG